jgi:hypothetical protein
MARTGLKQESRGAGVTRCRGAPLRLQEQEKNKKNFGVEAGEQGCRGDTVQGSAASLTGAGKKQEKLWRTRIVSIRRALAVIFNLETLS